MSGDPLFFGAFTVERGYDAAPERVFRAFADRETKQRWMGCEAGTAFGMDQPARWLASQRETA